MMNIAALRHRVTSCKKKAVSPIDQSSFHRTPFISGQSLTSAGDQPVRLDIIEPAQISSVTPCIIYYKYCINKTN